jgi:hypothetical protein
MIKQCIVGGIALLLTTAETIGQVQPWPAVCLTPEQFVELVDEQLLSLEITSSLEQQLIGSMWSGKTGTFVFTVLDKQQNKICVLLAFNDGKRIPK